MNPKLLRENVKIRKGETVKLIMKSVNPRDVAYVFRDYARRIHSKVARDDPNLLKLSVACGKIEQWTEHHYPTFLMIIGGAGDPRSSVDPSSNDARALLYTEIARRAAEKASKDRQEAFMADLRARGIIKEKTPQEEAEAEEKKAALEANEEKFPYLLVFGVIAGVILLMVALGGAVTWVVVNYLADY